MHSFLHASPLSTTESGSLSNLVLTFLTRPGCHLCDEARPLVQAEATRAGLAVNEVNVDRDDWFVSVFGMRIPVLLGKDGEVLAEGIIGDRTTLRKKLKTL